MTRLATELHHANPGEVWQEHLGNHVVALPWLGLLLSGLPRLAKRARNINLQPLRPSGHRIRVFIQEHYLKRREFLDAILRPACSDDRERWLAASNGHSFIRDSTFQPSSQLLFHLCMPLVPATR